VKVKYRIDRVVNNIWIYYIIVKYDKYKLFLYTIKRYHSAKRFILKNPKRVFELIPLGDLRIGVADETINDDYGNNTTDYIRIIEIDISKEIIFDYFFMRVCREDIHFMGSRIDQNNHSCKIVDEFCESLL
jgi:hypothetical protein